MRCCSLITRTLTKYPVDYALFRELIQNSSDAKAKSCVISFKSTVPGGLQKSKIKDIGSIAVDRLTVKNNGLYFKEDDWSRLREIAKGNPDETKIGAFGVGFYSVFELTDEPLVHSGTQLMSFYYDGDQLCYRRQNDVQDSDGWTVIDLPYRSPQPLPSLSLFTAFLTLSFILLPLENIELKVDDITLLKLSKTISPAVQLELPKGLNYTSPDKTLTLKSWSSESFSIDISYMNVTQISEKITSNSLLSFGYKTFSSFLPGSKDPSEMTQVSAHLRKVTGRMSVNVSSSFSRKMKETVLKPLPKEAIISMLTDNRSEKELSKLTPPLSDYVFPKDFNDAKVFIGFPTKQSSGFKSHVAINQLIPTMERTVVDMANAYVKDWNKQILIMSGILSRAVYEYEFAQLAKKYPYNPENTQPLKQDFLDDASYIMNRFEFQKSAPDVSVGQFVAYGFWRSSPKLSLPTQKGQVLTSDNVRIADDENSLELIENIPLIPKDVAKLSRKFLDTAVELGLLHKTNASDIERELKCQTLTPERFRKLCEWCIEHSYNSEISQIDVERIKDAGIVSDPKNKDRVYSLQAINLYQDLLVIPNDYPLPSTCLPAEIIGFLSAQDLSRVFNWYPLSLVAWLVYATENRASISLEQNMFLSPEFSEKVLMRLSSNFDQMDLASANKVIELLSQNDCVPTNLGLKKPSESYFQPIKLFPDLPIKSPHLIVSKSFLLSIGVRESVDVAFVLKLLTDPDPQMKWSTVDVIKYLTTNQTKFKSSDWVTLRKSSFFEANDGKLYMAVQLFPPNEDLEELGMICLKWPYWSNNLPEAGLIFKLGLKHHPTQDELLSLAHDPSATNKKSDIAFSYMLKNFQENSYNASITFKTRSECVKCELPDGKIVKKMPSEVFSDPAVNLFGFAVLDSSLVNQSWMLKISKSPDPHLLVDYLVKNPPSDLKTATKMFEFMSTVFGGIGKADRRRLQDSRFIPIEVTKQDKKVIEFVYPSMVYFAISPETPESQSTIDSMDQKMYSKFFHFVDFSANSRPFLSFVGVREKPTIIEITKNIVSNPEAMYKIASSVNQYMALLARIASHWDAISKDYALVSRMRSSQFLLGTVYDKDTTKNEELSTDLFGENDGDKLRYKLAAVSELVIADDVKFASLFRYDILVAPQNQILEKLYRDLGCRLLSQVVDVQKSLGKPLVSKDDQSQKLLTHITERCVLFLESNRDPKRNAKHFLSHMKIVLLSGINIQWRIKFDALNLNHSPPINSTVSAHLSFVTTATARDTPTLYVALKNLDWYDVSQTLVSHLSERAIPDTAIVLESLLASDLRSLQRKGYNVKKIIKRGEAELKAQKEAEEALAREIELRELEEKALREKKQKEERQMMEQASKDSQSIKSNGTLVNTNNANNGAGNGAGTGAINGVGAGAGNGVGGGQGWEKVNKALGSQTEARKLTPQSLPQSLPQSMIPQDQQSRGFFNKFMRNLTGGSNVSNNGMKNPQMPQQIEGAPGSGPIAGNGGNGFPPPASSFGRPNDSSFSHPDTSGSTSSLLASGFSKSRAFNGANFKNTVSSNEESIVESEQRRAESECDRSKAMDLQLAVTLRTKLGGGIKIYVSNKTPEDEQMLTEISGSTEWMKEADRFAYILRAICNIFRTDGSSSLLSSGGSEIPWSALHIFWDLSPTIAFNSGGSLFFNLSFFVKGNMLVPGRNPGTGPWYPAEQLDFWFTVAAHELAHNFVSSHGVAHSHFTESYVQKFLPRYKVVAKGLLASAPS